MHRFSAWVFLNRAVLAGLAWWVLTDGAFAWDALVIGAPAILAAAAASTALMPRIGGSVRGTFKYALFFARESLLGGVDVARRALDPRMPLDPGIVRARVRMPTDTARVMVANTLGLVPGSLSVEVDGEELLVHALDKGRGIERSIEATQRRVGALLGMPRRPRATPEADTGSKR